MRKAETYFTVETKDGKGLCFITECGNQMYHTGNNPMRYHGVLCPKCFWKNKKVTLYLEGTDEANKYCNADDADTETWNGYHGRVTAPKGTFKRIYADADGGDAE